MNQATAKSNKTFGIMYNQRTDRVYQRLKQMIENGELGHIKRITWIVTSWYRCQAYHNSSAWRSTWDKEGGGVLINQAIHTLDYFTYIAGKVKSVQAMTNNFSLKNVIEVEDTMLIYLEYEN